MKKKCIYLVLLSLAAVFMAVSCAGTPPPPAVPPPEAASPPPPASVSPPSPAPTPAPDQATLSTLNEAAARAAAARKMAGDFDAASFFPSDWESAESLFSQAEQQKNASTRDGAQESTARYIGAAEAYEALIEKISVLCYEDKAKELSDARSAAVNAGAGELVPDYLLEADNAVADAEDKYQAKDYYGAKSSSDDALAMYSALKDGVEAYYIREDIAERAQELIPDVLLSTDTFALDAIDKWEAKDYNGAKLGAAEALTMYSALKAARNAYDVREKIAERAEELFPNALSQADDVAFDAIDKWQANDFKGAKDTATTAWMMYLNVAASTERQTALDLKADTAARQEFNFAEAIYNRANAAYRGQRYEEAAPLYEECLPIYRMASLLALEKRLVAEEALRRADQRVAESDETARNAELILEGGAQ
jgi:hypothetical protein